MKKFEEELKELIKKHNVVIEECDHYDNHENYTGSTYYFQVGKQSALRDDDNYSLTLEELYD